MTTREDIERWLSLLPEEKRKQFQVVSRKQVGGAPYLYHISRNHDIDVFTPSVTHRTLAAEDRSIPRISTATTLAGCLLGYQSAGYDFESAGYRGWYIYGLPYRAAIKPSKALLPDVDVTQERWLVTFDPSTVNYAPLVVGKFFFDKRNSYYRLRQLVTEYQGYLEVKQAEGLELVSGIHVDPGIYRLTYKPRELKEYVSKEGLLVEPVNRAEYSVTRDATVELLSLKHTPLRGSQLW